VFLLILRSIFYGPGYWAITDRMGLSPRFLELSLYYNDQQIFKRKGGKEHGCKKTNQKFGKEKQPAFVFWRIYEVDFPERPHAKAPRGFRYSLWSPFPCLAFNPFSGSQATAYQSLTFWSAPERVLPEGADVIAPREVHIFLLGSISFLSCRMNNG